MTTKFRAFALASVFGLATITGASATAFLPQIPTPANPHPEFPIATDGSPLPPMGWAEEQPFGESADAIEDQANAF